MRLVSALNDATRQEGLLYSALRSISRSIPTSTARSAALSLGVVDEIKLTRR